MRILEVVVRYPPFVGGVEASVHEVARRLAARGHEVRVICADDPRGAPTQVDGVEVVRLPWRFKAANTNLCFGLGEAIRRERPDVIHTHLPTAFFAGRAAAAARGMGVPLVLTYHNDVAGEGIKKAVAGVYNRVFLPRLLESSARIVATNPRHSPRIANPVCIPWGVDTDQFHPPAEEPGPPLTVGFLSLLDVHHRYKGLEVLFEALRLLPEVRLRVGGKGEDADFYRRRAEEMGVADRVEFLGFVEDLNAFYGSCHVFALPSTDIREGFGLVLLEAMACGRPVLTTPIVGMAADIEQRGAGVLVAPNDPVALAEALRSLEDLPAMGRRARQLVEERYTWERAADDYEELFRSLTGSSSK
ncbi:MAG: glycosyltransferase family 4 protein [Thermoanaerobaculia bacterium]